MSFVQQRAFIEKILRCLSRWLKPEVDLASQDEMEPYEVTFPFFFLVAQKVTQRISKQNVTAGNEIFHRNQDLTSFGITQDAA